MWTGDWEPIYWHPWEHHYYVVCSCGYREDSEDKWDIYPAWAEHIMRELAWIQQ